MTDNNSAEKRPMLRSELDLALLTTDSTWGKNAEVSQDFKDKTTRTKAFYTPRMDADGNLMFDQNGKPLFEVANEDQVMWSYLSFFTRDFRLGNLSSFDGELNYCDYYTQLASDMLHEGFKKPFTICLSRVATKLELSQSKGGFFRRKSNTLTHENVNIDHEAGKAHFFGKARGGE